MSAKILCSFTGEGFISTVEQYPEGFVRFVADADIDADGANGQNGKMPAYNQFDKGSEYLANGGMEIINGRVQPKFSWYSDIVILDEGKKSIRVFDNGVIGSKTAYRIQGVPTNNREAYLDAETVPYIAVSPLIQQRATGVVLGCLVYAKNLKTGVRAVGMVGDIGPRNKIGEVSIEMARQLGIPSSPRNGGTDEPIIEYTLFPDHRFAMNGVRFPLMKMSGGYVE